MLFVRLCTDVTVKHLV